MPRFVSCSPIRAAYEGDGSCGHRFGVLVPKVQADALRSTFFGKLCILESKKNSDVPPGVYGGPALRLLPVSAARIHKPFGYDCRWKV